MSDLSDVIHILPTMKSGNELLSALEVLPEYDTAICDADAPVRLMALSDLYRVYVDAVVAEEGYNTGNTTAESELQGYRSAGVQWHHGRLRQLHDHWGIRYR